MFLSGDIQAVIMPDGNWRLKEDVVYKDGNNIYTVPVNYVTDGASVPRCVSWLYPKFDVYVKAAILHDWLITDLLEQNAIESNRVDELFKEAMNSLGIAKPRQWVMWAGVRLGAIGNKKRRKGSLKTLPKLLMVLLLASPVILIPSLVVQIHLWLLAIVSLVLPKRHKVTAQKT